MAKVKVAVVGCGAIGQRRHIPEAAANPNVELVAVVDPIKDRVHEVADKYGCAAYYDHQNMLKEVDCDAVVVGTPNALHAPQTLDAFKAKKHVLVEKPMATTREEAKKMIAAAKSAKKYLMIGMNQRLAAPHIKAKQVLKRGELGKVLSFQTIFAHSGPDNWSLDGAKSWFFKKKPAVMGATGDLGVHKADLMRWLLDDEIVEVGGFLGTYDKTDWKTGKPIGVDDNAYLTVRTASGTIGSLIASWTNYGRVEGNSTRIYCENGVMQIGIDPEYGVIASYFNGSVEKYKVGKMATNDSQTGSGVMDLFIESITKKKQPEISGEEGYAALSIILTAMEAAKEKKIKKVH